MKNRELTDYQKEKLASIREVFIDGGPGFERIDAGYEKFLADPTVQDFFLKESLAEGDAEHQQGVSSGIST